MKKSIVYIVLGLLVATVGIILLIHCSLGLDPLGAFVKALSTLTTIPYGTVLPIVNIGFLTYHFIKNKDIKFCIIALAMSILMGIIINVANIYIYLIPNDNLISKIILFISGFLIMSFGIAMIQRGKIQKMAFEAFQQTIAKDLNKDINFIRVFVEIALFILALLVFLVVILLKIEVNVFETINIGTPIIMLLTGPTVNVMYKKILKGE